MRSADPLLLADVAMPGMSGRELADRLAVKGPDMRVLYMSGCTNDTIVHHGVLDPGLSFLQKPFSREALMHKLREVLDGAETVGSDHAGPVLRKSE